MNICKRKALSSRRSCSLLSSGKWLLSASKKWRFLSLLFTIILLFGCVFSVSADDEILDVSNMSATMQREVTEGSTTITTNYTFTDGTLTRNGILLHWFSARDPSYYASGGKKLTTLYDYGDLAAGHDYEMTFYTGISFSAAYNLRVFVGSEKVYDHDFSYSSGISKSNVKFTTPSAITDSTRIQIVLTVPPQYNYGANGETVRYYISENLEFTDLTDNPKWLTKIKQWFLDLGDRISGYFNDIKTSVGNWLAEQAKKIDDFKNGVKQWFEDLGNRIQQYFTDLVDGLKSLFIPADGYFESKKIELETFCIDHFGALYQAPEVMLDFVKKLTTISPKAPSITMPAIQFDFQGVRYVLCDSITYSFAWVNDSSNALYYFYKFYRGFATLLLFLFFGNFCIQKYNEVFAGGDPD